MNREKLIKIVKALGQEVIDRAEDLVGEGNLITDLDIWLKCYTDFESIPRIEVTRSHASKRIYEIVIGGDDI